MGTDYRKLLTVFTYYVVIATLGLSGTGCGPDLPDSFDGNLTVFRLGDGPIFHFGPEGSFITASLPPQCRREIPDPIPEDWLVEGIPEAVVDHENSQGLLWATVYARGRFGKGGRFIVDYGESQPNSEVWPPIVPTTFSNE